ncbi:MAG: hypothetical protein M4579_000666 [Chaenotheca gracillima]|nr:MAG: hypothetical protein M4579_000666 [Chaenotheca gracillima]
MDLRADGKESHFVYVSTLCEVFPNLARSIDERTLGIIERRGLERYPILDFSQLSKHSDTLSRTCLKLLFQYLVHRDTDNKNQTLQHRLEVMLDAEISSIWRQGHTQRPLRLTFTNIFLGIGRLLLEDEFGNDPRIVEQVSSAFQTKCRSILACVDTETFLKYVLALDKLDRGMGSTLKRARYVLWSEHRLNDAAYLNETPYFRDKFRTNTYQAIQRWIFLDPPPGTRNGQEGDVAHTVTNRCRWAEDAGGQLTPPPYLPLSLQFPFADVQSNALWLQQNLPSQVVTQLQHITHTNYTEETTTDIATHGTESDGLVSFHTSCVNRFSSPTAISTPDASCPFMSGALQTGHTPDTNSIIGDGDDVQDLVETPPECPARGNEDGAIGRLRRPQLRRGVRWSPVSSSDPRQEIADLYKDGWYWL